mgnify:CR=1 FL=1
MQVMIRRHRLRAVTLADLVDWHTLTPVMADFLSAAVRARRSIVVSGGQGDGKTTLVRALCAEIDPWEVIGTFGKGSEGIKIQMPMGTDVRAVEGGKVIYASSEMQTYGNLVLIQHDNGWVSAYGHADRLLVRTEDVVKKGQVIAKSGRSGVADQPQLHFELRQGSKPMDPIAYLDK